MTTEFVALLSTEWERAKLGAQEYIDAMPDDKVGFRPTPEIFSFAGQFLHIADVNLMFAAAAFGAGTASPGSPSENKPELQTKAAMRDFTLASYDAVLGGLKAISPDALGDEVQFFRFTMPRHVMIAKALEHHAHHRGQTAVYFRMQGMKPPSERLF